MKAAVSSARRVTSRTYYKLASLRIGEMIRLSSFLLSGTCLFCNTVLWVRDSNRTCRSNSIPQHCWSAFYWFFICSNLEFLVDFGNVVARGGSGGVLIRNVLFSLEYCGLFCCFLGWLYHIHKVGSFPLWKEVLCVGKVRVIRPEHHWRQWLTLYTFVSWTGKQSHMKYGDRLPINFEPIIGLINFS